MHLVDLPVEILLLVADNLPNLRDLSSFVRTNRRIYVVLNEYLYRGAAKNSVSALSSMIRKRLEHSVARLLKWTPKVPPKHARDQLLHDAVWGKQLGIARQLLEHWGTPSLNRQSRESYLSVAVYNKDTDMLRLLLQHGFTVNLPNFQNSSPLCEAVHHGSENIVMLLLDHGADIEFIPPRSLPPLHLAVLVTFHINVKLVELLVRKGADVNLQDENGNTALHHIARSSELPQRTRMAEILLENGADIHIRNHIGRTPLTTARTSGNKALQKILWARS